MGKKKYVLLPALMVCLLTAGGCGSPGKTVEDTKIREPVQAVQEEARTEELAEQSTYYDHDGREIRAGMEVIARLDEEGIAILGSYEDAVKVTVELSN